ncbi:uncharacterized protein J3D65DRAFT_254356 [Phyllosticta citribraziliensis]|uniref:Uncharacterized protein n=1 Tax=Phyllosticta citribraziliensis TaxID=989973 RepID=A0ABR1M352_9PEZI
MSSPFSSRAVLCVMEPTNKSRENTLLSFSISNRTKTPPHPLFHLAFPPESLVIPSHALLRLVSWLTPNQIAPSPTPHTHRVFRTRTLPFSAPQAKLNQQASRPTGHPIDRGLVTVRSGQIWSARAREHGCAAPTSIVVANTRTFPSISSSSFENFICPLSLPLAVEIYPSPSIAPTTTGAMAASVQGAEKIAQCLSPRVS